jgi:hypothetical protein
MAALRPGGRIDRCHPRDARGFNGRCGSRVEGSIVATSRV